ncbi:hypothetical protein IWZ03DRAFT_382582 [Phyllosticta citriasiana]|uniref:Secreted protein n=1 Tax=Phyllosticta citriasiana TaxID=595635 RepID=A0ABR1KGQ1_9PEZI
MSLGIQPLRWPRLPRLLLLLFLVFLRLRSAVEFVVLDVPPAGIQPAARGILLGLALRSRTLSGVLSSIAGIARIVGIFLEVAAFADCFPRPAAGLVVVFVCATEAATAPDSTHAVNGRRKRAEADPTYRTHHACSIIGLHTSSGGGRGRLGERDCSSGGRFATWPLLLIDFVQLSEAPFAGECLASVFLAHGVGEVVLDDALTLHSHALVLVQHRRSRAAPVAQRDDWAGCRVDLEIVDCVPVKVLYGVRWSRKLPEVGLLDLAPASCAALGLLA